MSRTNSQEKVSSKTHQSQGGYFRAPDCIFDLPLSAYAKLVLFNLCRRANQTGFSFPSLARIGTDCSLKSRTTILKAIKELEKAGLVVKDNLEGKRNTYQLSERVIAFIRNCPRDEQLPVHQMDNTCSFNEQPPVHEMNTKEYTYKEDTHKEGTCVLNNSQLERLEKKWIETFNTTYNRDSTEPPNSLKENLEMVSRKVAEKLPEKNTEEVFRHSTGVVEWYLSATEDSDPSQENRWVYRGERKSSRLARNFEVVWIDYWAVNQPVIEWKPPVVNQNEDVSQDNLVKKFESLPWYRKHKESKANGHTN